MKKIISGVAVATVALLLAACGKAPPPTAKPAATQAPTAAEAIKAAVADTTRLPEARVRDPFRKPAEILGFAGAGPGQTIIEIAPGGGYDTALLSRVVGPTGKVYSIDSDRLFQYRPNLRDAFSKYIAKDPRDNVEYSVQSMDALDVPDNVDEIWVDMFYHDTVWLGVDRAAMDKGFFDHLKPGGTLLVVDHRALPGSGEKICGELHRIDPAIVQKELEAAGFKLAAESDVLANPADPHTISVFDDSIRGRTDRFVFKFVKPE